MNELISLLMIIFLNLILSGDNAVVIALATLRLKDKQRKIAIFWGTFGAVALRIILTFIAAILLSIPFLQMIGGILLLWIALKLLMENEDGKFEDAPATILAAIKTVILADFLMSLDNVLAVAGASRGNTLLLVIGLLLSIPLVIWGSTFISRLMRKWPWLVMVGAGLLAWTAGEMIAGEPYLSGLFTHILFKFLLQALLVIGIFLTSFLVKKIPVKNKQSSGEPRILSELEIETKRNVSK